jgi:CheY-like chemotaxis protein
VTDLGMPGMTGMQLAVAIRADRPTLPILVATGYADIAADCDLPRVSKPFLPDDLARAIAACLRAAHGAQKVVPLRAVG